MSDDHKDIDSIIEEDMNSGVTASDISDLSAPGVEGTGKGLLERITVTAPLGSTTPGAPVGPSADESTPDVTDEHVAVVIDDGRIEDIAEFLAQVLFFLNRFL